MTTIKHAGVPVAVVPASSTRDMEEEIAYHRYDYVTEASDIFDKVLAAAPSEPGADLVELRDLVAQFELEWVCLYVASGGGRAAAEEAAKHDPFLCRSRAALAKWETPDD